MLQSRVPEAADGRPLADWLAQRFTYLDAAAWRDEIAAGRVLRNTRRAAVGDRLRAGDRIAYLPPAAAGAPLPTVLHADADLVAVDKPAQTVAHATSSFADATFVPSLAAWLGGDGPPATLHFVHRLDRETSGVLVLARTAAATAALQRQFVGGTAVKSYLALVLGTVAADRFTVDAPIGPAGGAIAARRAVVAAGSPGASAASTDFEVVQRLPAHTLLRASPRTGRTHQIRVHLEHAGHALLGDKMYGAPDERWLAFVAHRKAGGDAAWGERLGAGRQMLHAAALDLVHPTTGNPLSLRAPLPDDFAAALRRCGGEPA